MASEGGVYVRGRVQTTHKIQGSAATGFVAYLTSAERGDYYLSGEGEEGEGGGAAGVSRWHGSPRALAALGLSQGQPVGRDQLLDLMGGRSPATGEPIRAVGGDGSRVAGVDMTFSAPKSVSALWAVSSPYRQAQIVAAHQQAVTSALERVEREEQPLRSRAGGTLHHERAQTLVAAEFLHTASRLTAAQERGGVPDPQLHSHVVVVAGQRADGRFAAVDSRELFRSARENGAWYRAALAYQLRELGLQIERGTGKDGRYFQVAGVPQELAERWSARGAAIDRAAREFRDRYGRDPKAGELSALTVQTRGTKTHAASPEVAAAWRAVGAEHGLSQTEAERLFAERERTQAPAVSPGRDLARELLGHATRDRSMVTERELHAQAYELAAGVMHPSDARHIVAELERTGELVQLQGGMWTTRELREREQQTVALAASRAGQPAAPIPAAALQHAQEQTERDLGGRLSAEQQQALQTMTGPGGVTVLVGQAGTGKGVVIAAAASAWQQQGYKVIGTAVAGATAVRLQAEAKLGKSMTADSLIAQAQSGNIGLDSQTVVVMDEAGMADTNRLANVTEVTAERGSKLVLVGDSAQLSPIAAGGLFKELKDKTPSAELTEDHRAQQEWERNAWAQVRSGEATRALASYQEHDRLHIADTREQAAQQMVSDWNTARLEHPPGRTIMLTDASNHELDHINALAQEHRAANGELGNDRVPLPDTPYALATGDHVIFTKAHYQPGQQRVENGTLGTILGTGKDGTITIATQEPTPREVNLTTEQNKDLRLSYAQHVYKAQGRTVNHALTLMGGWQTDRERAYVALTRARERTDIYAARENLGEQDMNPGAIERLANAMAESHAQQASITRPAIERDPERGADRGTEPESGRPADPTAHPEAQIDPAPTNLHGENERDRDEHESEAARIMREQQTQEQDRDRGMEIE